MLNYLLVVILTLAPFLELRASIPYGIIVGLPAWQVISIAIVVNALLAPVMFLMYRHSMHIALKIPICKKYGEPLLERTRHKVHKYVEKYGVLGLAIFIGIPLPGSGVYSGALGAYLLGFEFKKFVQAAVLGVLIAGSIVGLIMVSGVGGLELFIKHL